MANANRHRVDDSPRPRVIGLPMDFELSESVADRLGVDAILGAEPVALTTDEAEMRVRSHLQSLTDQTAAQAFYLLFIVL